MIRHDIDKVEKSTLSIFFYPFKKVAVLSFSVNTYYNDSKLCKGGWE